MRCGGSVRVSSISWPAMRTTRERGRFVCNLRTTSSSISLVKRRRALCSRIIRSRLLRGGDCRTFQKSKMNCLRRAANGSSFSKKPGPFALTKTTPSPRRVQGQARPGVQQAQNFAHHLESIASVAPPVKGIEWIARGRAHNGPALTRSQPTPEQANATRMRFCGDQNYRAVLPWREGWSNDFDFVGGIHDWRFEGVNGFRRHSFVNQNEGIVMILSREKNAHFFESRAGLRGMGKPDFRRVSLAVEFRCFDGAQRHCAAEHHDRPGFRQRVLHHQPAADAEQDHQGKDQAATTGEEKNTERPGAPTRNRVWIGLACHWGTGACYPAPSPWSIGGARPRFYHGRWRNVDPRAVQENLAVALAC